jgi:hypothetical protein
MKNLQDRQWIGLPIRSFKINIKVAFEKARKIK